MPAENQPALTMKKKLTTTKKRPKAGQRRALGLATGSAWIAMGDRLPKPGEWVLIVLELGSGCNFVVGMGWRKISSDGRDTGWWDTNHGLVRDFLISHWQPTPPLPPLPNTVHEPRP